MIIALRLGMISAAHGDPYCVVEPVLNFGAYALPFSGYLRQLIVQKQLPAEKPSNSLNFLTKAAFSHYISCVSPFRLGHICDCFLSRSVEGLGIAKMVPTGVSLVPLSVVTTVVTSSEFFKRHSERAVSSVVKKAPEAELSDTDEYMPYGGEYYALPVLEPEPQNTLLGKISQQTPDHSKMAHSVCTNALSGIVRHTIMHFLRKSPHLVSLSHHVNRNHVASPDLTKKEWVGILFGVYGIYAALSYYERRVLVQRSKRK